jgi:UDP-3-O-[3-hydroxymyristoyl] glucosamine N-acyltransferase
MKKFTLEEITNNLRVEYSIKGTREIDYIDNFKSIAEADSHSLVWCSPDRKDKQELVNQTQARLIICDDSIELTAANLNRKCLIAVKNPRHVFSSLLRSITSSAYQPGIHPSAIIHPEAQIAGSAHIGPNTYIGKCRIGSHSIVHGNAYFYDNTSIGEGVTIEAGVILGAEGFGMTRDDEGNWERFPHLGGVEIRDRVEIGAGTSIDRGTLGNTIIGKGTKISKMVHISHNVITGTDCIITGGALIAGSTTIGDRVWISPNATILNKLEIGNDVFIATGAVVTQNIKDGFQAIGRKIMPGDYNK